MKRIIFIAITIAGLMAFPRIANADWPRETIGLPSFAEQIADIVIRGQKVAAAKQAANAELEQARRRFFADCVNGVRGSDAEKAFAELLLMKDIYFLSLYTNEGMTPAALRQLDGMDKLTGGKFDGGIPPWPADEAFGVWVNAVRTALHAPPPGNLWLPIPADFLDAITKTSDVYGKYKVLRDRAEFGRWRKSIRTSAPPAKTTEEFADRYIKYILNPAIEETLPKIPESERVSALEKIDVWREQLRHAIIDFENVKVTPEKVADEMRRQNFNEDLIQVFLDTVNKARQSGAIDLNEAIISSQQDAIDRLDHIRDPRLRGRHVPPPSSLEWANRWSVYANEAGKLMPDQLSQMQPSNPSTPVTLFEYLYGPGQPVKFARDTYQLSRRYLKEGRVAVEPEYSERCQ
jgi:hypothetical protein